MTSIPNYQLPASIADAPKAVATAAAEYRELIDRWAEATRRVAALEREVDDAKLADRVALATAMRAGEEDPGAKNLDSLTAEIEATRREAAGLADAANSSWAGFKSALREHGVAYREALADEDANGQEAKLIAQLRRRVEEKADRRAMLDWLDNALRAVNGGTVRNAAIPWRFPSQPPTRSASIKIGQTSLNVEDVVDALAAWLDG